jgi:hypothetical protein
MVEFGVTDAGPSFLPPTALPSRPVDINVDQTQVTSNSALVSWTSEQGPSPEKWIVQYRMQGMNINWSEQEVLHQNMNLLLENLGSSTPYEVVILGENSSGRGDPSDKATFKTRVGKQ